MVITEEDIWFGSDRSFRDLQTRLSSFDASKIQLRSSDEDEMDINPVRFNTYGPIAVLDVSGPLISRGDWFTQYIGIVSYEDIKSRLAELGEEKSIKAILMNYDTPGGDAKGCKLCARYIREFSQQVKPVASYTENMAASAGYWLYAAGEASAADEEARLGSVGAIMVHTEYTEMDRKLGITRKVFRSTPYKALGTPYEKLSEEAEAEIVQEMSYLHDSFVSGIAELRGMDKEEVSSTIADGKMYRTKQALRLGMTDYQLSLEETVAKLASNFRK